MTGLGAAGETGRVAFSFTLGLLLVGAVPDAAAQPLDAERAWVHIVGRPSGGVRDDRGGSARTGRASSALPGAGLRTVWQASLDESIAHAPLVDADRNMYVLGAGGKVLALAPDGSERWRLPTGATQPNAGSLLADGTMVFVGDGGDAFGVAQGALRWRTRFGRAGGGRGPAALALDDGGAVVATSRELAAIDASGRVRSRVVLPEPAALPLVAALGQVVVIARSGTVWGWAPGFAELARLGNFGAPITEPVALANPSTLVGVVPAGARIVSMDLRSGSVRTLAAAADGLWIGPPALLAGAVFGLLETSSGDFAVETSLEGAELGRALLSGRPRRADADAGAPAPFSQVPPPGPWVDGSGKLAFALATGAVGVVSGLARGETSVEILAEVCGDRASTVGGVSVTGVSVTGVSVTGASIGGAGAVAGLSPVGPAELVVACRSGRVVGLRGR